MDEFARLKWELLGDAAFEGSQMLWEPFADASNWLTRDSPAEHERLAEQALRELHQEGLIRFFRLEDGDLEAAEADASQRLPDAEVDEVLARRGRQQSGDAELPLVWWYTTPKGQQLAEDPPPEIRRIWRPDEFGEPVGADEAGPVIGSGRSGLRAVVSRVAAFFGRQRP